MTIPAVEQSGWREGSKCTVCPPWVTMCAHYDGRVLILADDDRGNSKGHTCNGGYRPFDYQGFSIHLLTGGIGPCGRTEDCPVMVFDLPCLVCKSFDTLPAARAEFDRRAAQLLGREA